MDRPKISVLLPTYNHEDYIEECVESVLNQTYRDFEFIVADDASTDGTVEKLLKYQNEIDEIHLFDENAGARDEFLRSRASGKYIAVINSDDVWEPEKLEKQIMQLEKNPSAVACFTWCERIDEKGNKLEEFNPFVVQNRSREEWMKYLYFKGNCFAHASILVKRDIYLDMCKNSVKQFRQIPDFYRWVTLLQKYDVVMLEEKLTRIRTLQNTQRKNVSVGSTDNLLRQFNEESFMWYKIIEEMDQDFFLQVFKDELIDAEAKSQLEVMCEKFFILLQTKLEYCKVAAIFFVYNHYDEMSEWLVERYGFTYRDIHNLVINVGPSRLLRG